jgi:DNA primase
MPGIDFDRLRAEITMEEVLRLLGFEPARRTGPQWYGCCPLRGCTSERRHSFSVNVTLGRYYCHHCRSHGHQLELWAATTALTLHRAAIELCGRLGREVPWIQQG